MPDETTKIEMPLLDDTPLYVTVPNLKGQFYLGFTLCGVWFITFGSFFLMSITLGGRADPLQKPNRLNVRDTPLRLPDNLRGNYQGGSSY